MWPHANPELEGPVGKGGNKEESVQARHPIQHNTANVLTESGRPWKNHEMTAEQVIRELRLLRYDRKPSIRGVAIQAGIDRKTLYRAMRSGIMSTTTAEAVGNVLQRGANPAYQNRSSP